MRTLLAVAALLAISSSVWAQGAMPNPRGNPPPGFPGSQSPFGNQGFPSGNGEPMRPGFSLLCRFGNQACRMDRQGPIGTVCTCRTGAGIPMQGVVAGQ
jgi:hypothetical protein